MIREKSSASALEHNMTAQFTQGVGDVQSPDVSYDGKKIVFSMRCPASNTSKIGDVPACTGAWNIWEYDMTVGGLANGTFRRLTATGNDDVEPTYLPAGGDRVGQRLSDIIQDAIRTSTDKYGQKGLLLVKAGITGDRSEYNNQLYSQVMDYDSQVTTLLSKLSDKEDAYYTKFANLETAMQKMNSQQSWLSSQFGSSSSQ
jgi:hypothetical protein